MLKHNQYSLQFMGYRKYLQAHKSDKSHRIGNKLMMLVPFNHNRVNKNQFMQEAGLSCSNFARDTKQLREQGLFITIRGDVYINPDIIWAGSKEVQKYRRWCYKHNVAERADWEAIKDSIPDDEEEDDNYAHAEWHEQELAACQTN
jgi:hypothetical protein